MPLIPPFSNLEELPPFSCPVIWQGADGIIGLQMKTSHIQTQRAPLRSMRFPVGCGDWLEPWGDLFCCVWGGSVGGGVENEVND